MSVSKKGAVASKKAAMKYTIDCSEPDEIFDLAAFTQFLQSKIKVGGKVGVLGDNITVAADNHVVSVSAKVQLSKRYLKYLTKKFLKKNLLRDHIRVISKGKQGYFLRYFSIAEEGAEADN